MRTILHIFMLLAALAFATGCRPSQETVKGSPPQSVPGRPASVATTMPQQTPTHPRPVPTMPAQTATHPRPVPAMPDQTVTQPQPVPGSRRQAISGSEVPSEPYSEKSGVLEAEGISAVPKLDSPRQILRNGSFEEWKGECPEGWVTTPFTTLVKSEDARQGTAAIELPPGSEGNYALLQQRLPPNLIVPGGTLTITACARADAPNQFIVKLMYKRQNDTQTARAAHPGNGRWEAVSLEVNVPNDVSPSTFVLQLLRRPNTEGRVLIDEVSVVSGPKPSARGKQE